MEAIWDNKELFKTRLAQILREISGKEFTEAGERDIYRALQLLIQYEIAPRWRQDTLSYAKTKEVYYFSIEILVGRILDTNLLALQAEKTCREVLDELGVNLNHIEDLENEPGLGNGGLGRLFACFMESLATLGFPGHGVSLLYKTGLMRQAIDPQTGRQIALPDHWNEYDHLGLSANRDERVTIDIGGKWLEKEIDGVKQMVPVNGHRIHIIPWYMPVIGYGSRINNLMLLSTDVCYNLDNDVFDTYLQGNINSNPFWKILISLKLYPSAKQDTGKWLRFVQEAVLAIGGLRLILHKKIKVLFPDQEIATLPLAEKQAIIRQVFAKLAFQINDTHPALLVPSVMQILLDEYGILWDEAWQITQDTIAYTNHTVRPEALETWEIDLFKKVLPRHYAITEEIGSRFRKIAKQFFSGNTQKVTDVTVINRLARIVKMSNLAIIGSHSVNGVARLHTDIIRSDLFKSFYELYPKRFNNKTNGITHRRFLWKANPELATVLDNFIGSDWRADYTQFNKITTQQLANNDDFINSLLAVKAIKKKQLAADIEKDTGFKLDPQSLFDSHVKRFHEYKRQLMQLLHILTLIIETENNAPRKVYPRSFIFAGKAPEDYYEAKLTIKLIKYVQERAKALPEQPYQVLIVPNYNVTWAEKIFAGSNLSEQIPKAGQEASGTGLFKALFNGALIVGTHDGANIEVAEAVGEENIFLFGTKVDELSQPFNPKDALDSFEPLATALEELRQHPEFNLFYRQLHDHGDPWAILRDFMEFYTLQEDLIVPFYYKHPQEWTAKTARAMGRAGGFSSDRTIQEYAHEIWGIKPLA